MKPGMLRQKRMLCNCFCTKNPANTIHSFLRAYQTNFMCHCAWPLQMIQIVHDVQLSKHICSRLTGLFCPNDGQNIIGFCFIIYNSESLGTNKLSTRLHVIKLDLIRVKS